MQNVNLQGKSEMATLAGYSPETQVLYLTYRSGPTTVAYQGVPQETFEELRASAYPDVCIRFKIQARHPFRRINRAHEPVDFTFVK